MKNILFFFLIVSIAACVQQIEFGSGETNTEAVNITGTITDGTEENAIKLQYPGAYSRQVFDPISNARVYVIEVKTGKRELCPEDLDTHGSYVFSKQIIQPTVNQSYALEAILEDGSVLQSVPETMPEPVKINKSEATLVDKEFVVEITNIRTRKDFIEIYVESTLPTNTNNLYWRWDVNTVYLFRELAQYWNPFKPAPKDCFVTDYFNNQNIQLLDGTNAKGGTVLRKKLAERIVDYAFDLKGYFNIYQYSISRESYEYWQKVQKTTQLVGGIFDSPPATIQGNVFDSKNKNRKIFGYFEVASVSSNHLRIDSDFFPFDYNINPFCQYTTDRSRVNSNYCIDCISLRNSTWKRPVYWQ